MKTYQLMGIDTAMHLLRPGAKWEISNHDLHLQVLAEVDCTCGCGQR
jgi:hypothetical protein